MTISSFEFFEHHYVNNFKILSANPNVWNISGPLSIDYFILDYDSHFSVSSYAE